MDFFVAVIRIIVVLLSLILVEQKFIVRTAE